MPALYRKSGVERRGSVLLLSDEGSLENRQAFYPVATPQNDTILEEPIGINGTQLSPSTTLLDSTAQGPTTAERMYQYDRFAPALLELACKKAISDSAVSKDRITHLITVSCSGFSAPGVDLQLIHRLGLSSEVQRTHVGFMGCHGAINGLRVAKAIAESNPDATVLLGAVELCSIHQQYTDDPQQLVANSLFADGAAGVVISSNALERDTSNVDSRLSLVRDWRLASVGSTIVPESAEMMHWRIGDFGFEMGLSSQVPSIVEQHLKPWMDAWLKNQRLTVEDVDLWAIHPGGPRIVQAAGQALGLSDDATADSRNVLAQFGNMSSPTVLFILQQQLRKNADAKKCVLLAFGPGLCIEAALLTKTPD